MLKTKKIDTQVTQHTTSTATKDKVETKEQMIRQYRTKLSKLIASQSKRNSKTLNTDRVKIKKSSNGNQILKPYSSVKSMVVLADNHEYYQKPIGNWHEDKGTNISDLYKQSRRGNYLAQGKGNQSPNNVPLSKWTGENDKADMMTKHRLRLCLALSGVKLSTDTVALAWRRSFKLAWAKARATML